MYCMASPPMRGRGSKPGDGAGASIGALVAPHAGAWIETTTGGLERITSLVAPHAGAWIETDRQAGRGRL